MYFMTQFRLKWIGAIMHLEQSLPQAWYGLSFLLRKDRYKLVTKDLDPDVTMLFH